VCDHIIVTEQKRLAYLCVPLSASNEIYGLLYIEILKKETQPQILIKNEALFINTLAEIAALALVNVRLRENLSYQSVRDPLTSLYNRRYLNEFLFKLIYQSQRAHLHIAVLMLDFDHFKRINDVHGHEAGDLVLKEVSQLLGKKTRSGDLISRYGGEEFIIILYNTDTEAAVKRAEDIRESISLLHIKFSAQEIGEITASIGVAIYPQDGKTSIKLIEAADKALYVAK
jgi:diguanylate cyclase (GGDEF)-like protein